MSSYFPNFLSRSDDDLERQVERLKHDLTALSRSLSRRGSRYYDDARESTGNLYEEMSERVADAMPHLREQARHAGKTARENPVATAAVGLAIVGLLALLVSRR